MLDAAPFQNAAAGTNMAPLKPLLELAEGEKKPYECSSLHETVREWYNDISNRNLHERREIARSGELMSNLRSGKQIMRRDPVFGTFALLKGLPRRTQSDAHVYPLAQVNSTQLTSIWMLSRPKTVPRHFGNSVRAQIQQTLIERVIEHYDTQCMDDLFHARESLSMMDYGTAAIRVEYDDKLNRVSELRPIIENRSQAIFPGYGFCMACQSEGTAEDFMSAADVRPQCKKCGDYNVSDLVLPEMVDAPQIIGSEEYNQGDITLSLLEIPALNWDFSKFIQDSDYVQYRSQVRKGFAEAMLGVELAAEDPDRDYGLRSLNALGTRGGSVAGQGRENLLGNYELNGDTAIMDELWFKPEWYAGIRLSEEEETVSGDVIPKGVPLEQVFPDGICAVGFNEMKVLVGVYGEKCRIKSSVYHIQSASGVGKGTQDALELSEHLNIAHSAALAQLKRLGAGGGTWYDSDVLTEAEARAMQKPGALVGVKMRGTQYNSIDQALKKIEVGQLDERNLTMVAQLSNALNIVFQTTDFTSGVADNRVDVNTLGGQQLLQAQNQQRSAAPLRMKAYLRARVFEEVIDLFREYIRIPKFFGVNDKFGLAKGRFISGEGMPEKVYCDAMPNSERPKNDLTDREDLKIMLESLGQSGTPFFDILQMSPRVAAWVADRFNVDMPLFNYSEILIVSQERLDKVKELALMQEQVAAISGFYEDPAMVGEAVVDTLKIPATEDNLVIKAQVLQEYLDDDEVTDWTDYQRAAVQALIWRLYQLDIDFRTQLTSREQMGQLSLQAQAASAGMAMQQPLMEQAQAQEGEAAARDQENQALGTLSDLLGEERAFERGEEGKEADAERGEAQAERDHKRSLELEKQKQKGKPPAKKGR